MTAEGKNNISQEQVIPDAENATESAQDSNQDVSQEETQMVQNLDHATASTQNSIHDVSPDETQAVQNLELDSPLTSSLVSSVADSEEDLSSRDNSDRSGKKKKNRVRFADNSITSLESTIQDGFLFNVDPFSAAKRQCPRHILRTLDRLCKVPDAEIDEFGVVSKRALPEHYYANTMTLGLTTNRKTHKSPDRSHSHVGSLRRDKHSTDDYSHPRCFANPKNNVKLTTIYDMQNDFLDTNLTASNGQLHSSSKNIRFNTADGRQTDSPSNSSHDSSKSPGPLVGEADALFYGQRRPGVKKHNCLKDGKWK